MDTENNNVANNNVANNDIENDIGSIKITDEVIAIIAGIAVMEVSGVCSMSGGFAGGISEILGRKNLSKGVKVEIDEKKVVIDLFIVVEYGCRIPEVAWNIQEKVKKSVEAMTDLNVTEVNIHVQGVNIEKEQNKTDTEEIEQPENNEKWLEKMLMVYFFILMQYNVYNN